VAWAGFRVVEGWLGASGKCYTRAARAATGLRGPEVEVNGTVTGSRGVPTSPIGNLFAIMPAPASPHDGQATDLPGAVLEPTEAVKTSDLAASVVSQGAIRMTSANLTRQRMEADLTAEVSSLHMRSQVQTKRRLEAVLLPGQTERPTSTEPSVGPEELQKFLRKKRLQLDTTRVKVIMKEIHRIGMMLGKGFSAHENSRLPFSDFVDLIMMPSLDSWAQDPALVNDIGKVQTALLTKSVDEVISKATAKTFEDSLGSHDGSQPLLSSQRSISGETAAEIEKRGEQARRERFKTRLLQIVNNVAYITIVLSIVKFGLQMDIQLDEDGWAWYVMEAGIAFVFCLEFLIKNLLMGPSEYFCGSDRYWNWLDAFITGFAVADSAFQMNNWGRKSVPAAKLTTMVRMVRISRVARMLKALRIPFVRDLASMLVGLFIGAPQLVWVTVLLGLLCCFLAMGLREVVGPGFDDELLLDKCGPGDTIKEMYRNVSGYSDGDECPIHKLLGEEFFWNVPLSMFTVFRCLIGDCSTASGQSLVVHLAKGWGWRFYVVYFLGMTAAIFGVFNIITAMFVDATLAGLRSYHSKERQLRLYEVSNVRASLHALVQRIHEILGYDDGPMYYDDPSGKSAHLNKLLKGNNKKHTRPGSLDRFEEIMLTDVDFVKCMRDPVVKSLLEGVDIDPLGLDRLFDIFDTNCNGYVSVPEMVETLVKMRGELNKADVMANWLTLRSLQERFNKFQLLLLANQKQMMDNQSMLLGK
jgi:hypothetical protein